MAEVILKNVGKAYGQVVAVRDFNLTIADQEFVVLVGPSGCGKSTTLRMVAGLEEITSGVIAIGGKVVNELPPKDRDIAMVFQSYALYPHLTVAENLGFSLKMRRAPKAETAERVLHAARTLGLEPLLDRKPKALSGGQRQRVAMGRAIVRDPKVFLFDEPLSNLDAKLRVQMRGEIKTLHRRLGTTTIYVTHDQVEAMTMADKIVVLKDGSVAQTGRPMDLYDRPADTFVAGFIGSPAMNLIPAEVDGPALRLADGSAAPVPPVALEPGRAVLLGVRPEDFRIGTTGIAAVVTLVEPTGSETLCTLQMGAQPVLVLSRDRRPIAEGDRVHLTPDPASLHIFDSATGLRLG